MNSITIRIADDVEQALSKIAASRGISLEELLSDQATRLASQSDAELLFRAMAEEGVTMRDEARAILKRTIPKRTITKRSVST